MNKITSFSIRLDIPDTDLRERDISYLIDKALRPIIDENKFENVEIDVVDITEIKLRTDKIKHKSPPLWGGTPLFKTFDKYNCRECGKEYLEANLIPHYDGRDDPFYFCIRCHNRKYYDKT